MPGSGETPKPTTSPACSLSFPFFKTQTTNTTTRNNHARHYPKMASERGQGSLAWPVGNGGRGRRENKSIAESVLLIPAGAGQGLALPHWRRPPAAADRVGTGGALRAGTDFKTMGHIMQYPQWAPGGGEGWTPQPLALGTRQEWCPPWVGDGTAATPEMRRRASRQEAGIDGAR